MAAVSAMEVRITQGDREPDVGRFTSTLTRLAKALDEIDRAAIVERVPRPTWVVNDLAHERREFKVRLTAAASARDRESLMMPVTALVNGVRALQQAPELPEFYSETTVHRLIGLAIPRDGIHEVSLAVVNGRVGEHVPLSQEVVAHARAAVRQAEVSIGSITGSLDAIRKVRNGVRATIYDPVRHRAVTCSAGLGMADDIRKAWNHRVTLRGKITRNAYGQPIRMTVGGIEALPDDDSGRAPVRDLYGALPDMTGGLSVTEFLDQARRRA